LTDEEFEVNDDPDTSVSLMEDLFDLVTGGSS